MERRIIIGVLLVLTPAALAGFTATATGPFAAEGYNGSPLNGSFTYEYSGTNFYVDYIHFTGNVTSNETSTWFEELGLKVTDPTGTSVQYANFTGSPWSGTREVALDFNGAALAGTAGTYTFSFFDTDNNGSGVDAWWTDVAFNVQSASHYLSDYAVGTLQPGDSAHNNTALSEDFMDRSNGWGQSGANDMIYAVDWDGGNFRAEIEFDQYFGDLDLYLWGDNLATTLLDSSMSSTDQGTLNDPLNEHEYVWVEDLPAGTYYLHVEGGWTGNANVFDISVNLPEPTSLVLLAIGGLAVIRRK